MIKKIFSYLLITTFLIIIAPLISFGQLNAVGDFVNISINPANPSPGAQVEASVQSLSIDLDKAKITWSINGVEKVTGIGQKKYYLEAGAAGKMITVGVRTETADGNVTKKEISFTPAGVHLLFEFLSYTPPFYKGKALNPNQGSVIVVAMPEILDKNGAKISTDKLVYKWEKDGTVVQSASGLGKNYLTFSGSVPIRDTEVQVSVSSVDGGTTANNSVNITSGSPKIIFYENSPTYGIMFNKAINGTVKLLTDEFSVIAVPYSFSVGYAATPDLDYVWSMNGAVVGNQDPKNSFTTRVDKAGAGTADIGLKINNNSRIFQFADGGYSINFNKQ